MTGFESLCTKLSPLGLYYIKENSNIYNELCCYGIALDEHRAMMDELLRECFITTAVSYGLENRELIVGNIKSDYTTERRRKMLIYRNTLGENDFTKEGIGKFLSGFGVTEYQITEIPSENELTIYINGDYSAVDKKWIEKQVNMILPAHLVCNVYFSSLTWKSIESKSLTFAQMDEKDYTWYEINNLA